MMEDEINLYPQINALYYQQKEIGHKGEQTMMRVYHDTLKDNTPA